jgi:serine protease Do
MKKSEIIYTDEVGKEHVLGKEKKHYKKHRNNGIGFGYYIFILIMAVIMGAVGSVGSLMYLSNNQEMQEKLGLGSLTIPVTRTERIKLEESSAITDTVKGVVPAVVSITTTQNIVDLFGRTYQERGGGTGFIITSDGLIVTNKHVVSNEKVQYKIFTHDGNEYDATIVASDPFDDLAVLKIEASGLPTIKLGDSDDIEIGQWVVAVGNALGEFSNSVTVGVISAKERQITATGGGVSERLEGLLQTDAAINPGNSGGPLVNLSGQVIGINTAIAGEAENIGFAIPINSVKKAIESIKKTGEIKRPMIGIRYIPITKEIAIANQLEYDYGIWVLRGSNHTAVIPGSPADIAGISENDIILEIDDQKIDENNSLIKILRKYDIGDEVTLKVLQRGQINELKLKLTESK